MSVSPKIFRKSENLLKISLLLQRCRLQIYNYLISRMKKVDGINLIFNDNYLLLEY